MTTIISELNSLKVNHSLSLSLFLSSWNHHSMMKWKEKKKKEEEKRKELNQIITSSLTIILSFSLSLPLSYQSFSLSFTLSFFMKSSFNQENSSKLFLSHFASLIYTSTHAVDIKISDKQSTWSEVSASALYGRLTPLLRRGSGTSCSENVLIDDFFWSKVSEHLFSCKLFY